MNGGPLQGVRVLDLTRLLPGPVATLHLADMGADVIKIEDHGAGDYARTMGEGPDKVSVFYRSVNRNKRGLCLDLKQAAGRDVFLRLASDADIVIESFRPGVTDKLGIGYDAVRAVNPNGSPLSTAPMNKSDTRTELLAFWYCTLVISVPPKSMS